MKKNAIVSLADSNYFELLDELINSIKSFEQSDKVAICILDAGLSDEQKKILLKKVDQIKPAENQMYRTSDVFDAQNHNPDFDFFPWLDEFITYASWYRKTDKSKTEEQNLKETVEDLKVKLFDNKNQDIKEMVKNKQVYDEKWLTKQLRVARIFELEDLLAKDAKLEKKQ